MLLRSVSSSVALLISLAVPANSQLASFHGPIAGFIYDHGSRSVRPLLGVTGAAVVGTQVVSDVDSASIAPDGKWALLTKQGAARFVHGLSDLAPAESPAEGLIDAVDRVAWSRNGNFALLYSSTGGQLQRIRLSDSDVSVDSPVTLATTGPVTVLAIDPTGQQIAMGITGPDAAGLYLIHVGQSPARLSSMAQPVAVAFDETGSRLYAADADAQQVLEFDSGAGGFEFARLSPPDGPALNPVGLAVSGNGRYLLLAESTTRTVLVYETASRNLVNTISLDFAPRGLEALSSGPSFLLNGDGSKEWLLVLDARQVPAVYFVPAKVEELL
jgi:WD40 repeat protein